MISSLYQLSSLHLVHLIFSWKASSPSETFQVIPSYMFYDHFEWWVLNLTEAVLSILFDVHRMSLYQGLERLDHILDILQRILLVVGQLLGSVLRQSSNRIQDSHLLYKKMLHHGTEFFAFGPSLLEIVFPDLDSFNYHCKHFAIKNSFKCSRDPKSRCHGNGTSTRSHRLVLYNVSQEQQRNNFIVKFETKNQRHVFHIEIIIDFLASTV